MTALNLCLHCGNEEVERNAVYEAFTPVATVTHRPIPHGQLIDMATDRLNHFGLTVVNEAHSLNQDGSRYFGLFQIASKADDFGVVVGLRNSHDKLFAAGFLAGQQVFVCDNLCFSGEVKIARKHTVNILRDLPTLMDGAVMQLKGLETKLEERVGAMKQKQLTDKQSDNVIMGLFRRGVIPSSKIGAVHDEYHEPSHEEFHADGKTVWTMHNAVTETLKGRRLQDAARRTMVLDGYCNQVATVPPVALAA